MSVIEAVFVASIKGSGAMNTIVGSSTVFPSLSSPSSEISEIFVVEPGPNAEAVTELIILPELAASDSII